jgi:hypothetical protein
MTFDLEFQTIKDNSLEIATLIKDSNKKTLSHLIYTILKIIDKDSFQKELNKIVYYTENPVEKFKIVYDLMESLMLVIRNTSNSVYEVQNSLKILQIISNLKLKEFLSININFILDLINLACNEYEVSDIILNTALNLSESISHETINIDREDIFGHLDDLSKEYPARSNLIQNIEERLRNKYIQACLTNLNTLYINNQRNVDELLMNEPHFIKHLRFLSSHSIKTNTFMDWNLFDSIEILTLTFNYLFETIFQSNDYDLKDKAFKSIDFLLNIILKLVKRPLKYQTNFIQYGIMKTLIELYSDTKLINFLFSCQVCLLYKIILTFFHLCRYLYYCQMEYHEFKNENTFKVLKILVGIFKDLDQKSDVNVMKEKPIYRDYLRSLGYLQENFRPNVALLDFENYYYLATTGFITNYFVKVSADYKNISFLTRWEFINENGRLEIQNITSIFNRFNNNSFTMNYIYITDVIERLKVFFSTENLKILAYNTHKIFFISLIKYGLDIEKVLCLDLVEIFSHVNFIKSDLLNEKEFLELLKESSEIESEMDPIKLRLKQRASSLRSLLES